MTQRCTVNESFRDDRFAMGHASAVRNSTPAPRPPTACLCRDGRSSHVSRQFRMRTTSVSGINTVLNTPPLSPKTVRERPVISPPYSRPLSRNSQSPQPPTCRRTSTDVPRVSPQAGTRHGQDIGIGLDGACVVARNRTRRRVAGCGGFPSGPVDLTLQEVRRRVRGAVARRQRSGPEQSSGTRPCGR